MSSDKIPPVMRGLIVAESIAAAGRPVTGTELEEMLGIPRQTIHRIALRLEGQGFIQREPGGRRFVAGPRARRLAINIHANSVFSAPRHAVLRSLAEEVNETCNCTLLDGGEIVYFDRVEANWPHRIQLPAGSRHPLHCTASGKLFLAYSDAARRKRLLSGARLEKYTERTITDVDALIHELARIKDRGVGTDNEEYLAGMVAIAVPVFDQDTNIYHTVAVHAPTIRISFQRLLRFLPALRRATSALSDLYSEERKSVGLARLAKVGR